MTDTKTSTKGNRAKGPATVAPVEPKADETVEPKADETVEPKADETVAPVETEADRVEAAMLATDPTDPTAVEKMTSTVAAILRTLKPRDREPITAKLAESDAAGSLRRIVAGLVTSVPHGVDPAANVAASFAAEVARFATIAAHAAAHLPETEGLTAILAALTDAATGADVEVWTSAAATVDGWATGKGRRTGTGATRSAPVLAGVKVPAGLKLAATYNGHALTCETVAEGDAVVFRATSGKCNGQTFGSPSRIAVEMTKATGTFTGAKGAIRGTTFWHVATVDGPTLVEHLKK